MAPVHFCPCHPCPYCYPDTYKTKIEDQRSSGFFVQNMPPREYSEVVANDCRDLQGVISSEWIRESFENANYHSAWDFLEELWRERKKEFEELE